MGIRFGVTTNKAGVFPFRVIARLGFKSAALMLVALLVCVSLFLALERPAMAQTETPTPLETPTPSATPTPAESSGSESGLQSTEIAGISKWILAIALITVIGVLVYIFLIQLKFYNIVKTLNKRGASVHTISAMTFGGGQPGALSDADSSTNITVEGPGEVVTGTLSNIFSVRLDPPVPNHTVAWDIEPSDMAGVVPPNGDNVKIIAAKVGKFKLRATVTSDKSSNDPKSIINGQGALDVEAVPPTSNSIELPYFGKAWGTVVLSILVVAIVAVLTLARELSSETAGVIITALLGYVFGVAVSTKGDGSAKDEKASP